MQKRSLVFLIFVWAMTGCEASAGVKTETATKTATRPAPTDTAQTGNGGF